MTNEVYESKTCEVYEKEIFNDYDAQCAAFREKYRERTKRALSGEKVDRDPTPNVDGFFRLNDAPDGGVTLTTDDFVAYFNRRYGGADRIGSMRRSVRIAQEKAEKRRAEQTEETPKAQPRKQTQKVRNKRKFAFLHAVLACMFVISVSLFVISGVALTRAEAHYSATQSEHTVVQLNASTGTPVETDVYESFEGENSVEIYPVEKGSGMDMAALLNALFFPK